MQNYDKNTKKILNGAAWLALSAIILKIIGLIYKIPMSYLLGDEGMGYFNSAYTVYTFFYIIGTAGIPKAISILCAKATPGEAKSIFSYLFKLYIIIGTILSVILFFSSNFLANLIGSKNSAFTILAISPSVFFVCGAGVLRGYLNGKMKFVPIAVSEIISGICKLVLGLLFAIYSIKCGFSLPIVCAFSILGITVGAVLGFIYLYSYYKIESKCVKREYLSQNKIIIETFKIGLPIAFAAALTNLVSIIDLSMIMNRLNSNGYSESVSAVIFGNYSTLSVPMFSLVTNLLSTISVAALPVITKSYSERKYDNLKNSLFSSLKLSLFISSPAFLGFLFFPYEILSAVFEKGSATLGATFLLCLAPGVIFYSLLIVINTVLEGTGRIKSAVTSLIIGAVFKCALGFILISSDSFGALGAPISTSASYAVSFFVSYLVFNSEKNVRIPIFKAISTPIFISLISLLPAFFVKLILINNEKSRINSFIILSVYGVFYLIFSLFSTIKRKKVEIKTAKCTKN